MRKSGGLCLPSSVVKRKLVSFTADNIDFLENTADGLNTLHGTIQIINQNQDNDTDVPVNEPLHIPDEIVPVDIDTKLINSQLVQVKPIICDEF